MPKDNEPIKFHLCPACFAREIDIVLHYDEDEDEYYCHRCAYEGKLEEIRAFYEAFTKAKYKDMNKHYP